MRKSLIIGFLLFLMITIVSCDQNSPSFEQNINLHLSKPDEQSYTIY